MDIGAHVSSSGGLTSALERADDLRADVVQIFTQSPRMWRSPSHSDDAYAAYREAQAAHPLVRATFCHATYLINLAAGNEELLEKSERCLVENLVAASALGAHGVVLHIGSHRGTGFDSVLHQVGRVMSTAIDGAGERLGASPCALVLENAAGAGGTVGRHFDELAAVIETVSSPDRRLGICLDTQHLFASGVAFMTAGDADETVARFDAVIGLERLSCLHLNDSKVPFGANRDRHENLGEGEIGQEGLGALLSHERLQGVPAILEVPGAGDGPRAEDVALAREILEQGLKARRGAGRSPGAPASPARSSAGESAGRLRRKKATSAAPTRSARARPESPPASPTAKRAPVLAARPETKGGEPSAPVASSMEKAPTRSSAAKASTTKKEQR